MEKKLNEFKISALRQFGSENVSFTATVYSEKPTLSEEEIDAQVAQIGTMIMKAFVATEKRGIEEKDVLIATSEARTAGIKKLTDALNEEMAVKKEAEKTMKEAEYLSKKLDKKTK